jgi:hypothetical protein
MNERPDERLVPVLIPPLVDLLRAHQTRKGEPLTRSEVERIRDGAIAMMMSVAHARLMEKSRGYPDLDPANAWDEWQAVLAGQPKK